MDAGGVITARLPRVQLNNATETYAMRTGSRLATAERQLQVLFAAGGKKTANAERVLNELGSSMGLSGEETKNLTVEGGIQILQMRYEAAKRAFLLLSEMLKSSHEMMMAVIRNIGR